MRVAVVRLPRISNFTDLDALIHEPGVAVRFTESSREILASDLAVIPGTKATVEDLKTLRSRGLGHALAERARRGLPTLGICGGYQMLGRRIADGVESGEGEVLGLDLLPVETVFGEEKILTRPEGHAPGFGDMEVSGYEIRHGRVRRYGGEPLFAVNGSANAEGCRTGTVLGTSWHGIFESDGFRRAFLSWVAEERGLDWVAGEEPFARRREAQLEKLGDLVAENIDREALLRLIEGFDSTQLSAISCQLVGRTPKPPHGGAPREGAETPPIESTAVSAQAAGSAVEAKLRADG